MLLTENLYLGAFVLLNGAELKRVRVSRVNGRTTAVFEIDGACVQRLSDEYLSGTAVVNLADYRKHLEGLKDELFAALKRNETERTTDHADRPNRRQHARL